MRDRSRSCCSAMRRTTGVTGGAPPSPRSGLRPSPSPCGAGRSPSVACARVRCGAGAWASASTSAAGSSACASSAGFSSAGAWPSPAAPVSIVASTVPTSTVSPTSTSTSLRSPAAGAGTSVSTLSVEIWAIGSSDSTESPGCFFHSTMVPSATDTPIWGIVTSISPSLVGEELTACLLDVVDLWENRPFERRAERDRHVRRGDAHHRAVEVLEGLLRDQRGDLGRNSARARRLLNEHHLAGLAHAGQHGVAVVRAERAEIEDLDRRAVQVLGRLERGEHHRAVGDDREVLAFAGQPRLAERRLVAPL